MSLLFGFVQIMAPRDLSSPREPAFYRFKSSRDVFLLKFKSSTTAIVEELTSKEYVKNLLVSTD